MLCVYVCSFAAHQRNIVYNAVRAQRAFSETKRQGLLDMTQRWQKREVSNYDYLMYVNRYSRAQRACVCCLLLHSWLTTPPPLSPVSVLRTVL